MARLARLFVPGCAQHIIQRGHNRMQVFRDDTDRQLYLTWLIETSQARSVAVHGYVLMPNHIHLLVTAPSVTDLSRLMQAVNISYVRHFNKRYGRTGTLWESRYRSAVILSERYLMACYRYIDLNPVRGGLVADPIEWPWSSYARHIGERADSWISDHSLYWSLGNTPYERQAAYKALCQQVLDQPTTDSITRSTLRGWGLGNPAAAITDARRPLFPNPRGRPRHSST
jgi:putative transposase